VQGRGVLFGAEGARFRAAARKFWKATLCAAFFRGHLVLPRTSRRTPDVFARSLYKVSRRQQLTAARGRCTEVAPDGDRSTVCVAPSPRGVDLSLHAALVGASCDRVRGCSHQDHVRVAQDDHRTCGAERRRVSIALAGLHAARCERSHSEELGIRASTGAVRRSECCSQRVSTGRLVTTTAKNPIAEGSTCELVLRNDTRALESSLTHQKPRRPQVQRARARARVRGASDPVVASSTCW
jgi:hypothetical protein